MIRTAVTLLPIALMGCLNVEKVSDIFAPDIVILSPNEGSTHDPASVSFCAHIFDEDPIDQLDVTLTSDVDGDLTPAWELCAGGNFGAEIALLTEGPHILTVDATDLAGNAQNATVSFSAQSGIINTNTAPTCTFIAPLPGALVAPDSLVAVEATVDDQEDQAQDLTLQLSSDLDGELPIEAAATDGTVVTTVTLTTVGAQTLTMTVTDTEGMDSTCSVSITVDQP
jgi:hypothetical protein